MKNLLNVTLLWVLLAPAGASAGETTGVLLSIHGGLAAPAVFNELSVAPEISLGAGYLLPVLERRLAAVVDATYGNPRRDGGGPDPRLAAARYSSRLTQESLGVFVGGHLHFADVLADQLIPYAGLGLRVNLLRSTVEGSAGGAPLGTSAETSTSVGGALRGGLGLRLGPGFGSLGAEMSLVPIDHLLTGDANASALSFTLGYTLVL